MLDLTKKYTYKGHKVIDIHHYPERSIKYDYLVVYRVANSTLYTTEWITSATKLLIEVKPIPVEVTRWLPLCKPPHGGFYIRGLSRGYASKEGATMAGEELSHNFIKAIEITIPVEEE